MRVSQIFVRRYHKPPDGQPSNTSLSRWQVEEHIDASDLSISIELSPSTHYTGGLYFADPITGEPQHPPPIEQGSASLHRGRLSHSVAITSGERWSVVVFFFRSCAAQTQYFSAQRHQQQTLLFGTVAVVLGSLKWYTSRLLARRDDQGGGEP